MTVKKHLPPNLRLTLSDETFMVLKEVKRKHLRARASRRFEVGEKVKSKPYGGKALLLEVVKKTRKDVVFLILGTEEEIDDGKNRDQIGC